MIISGMGQVTGEMLVDHKTEITDKGEKCTLLFSRDMDGVITSQIVIYVTEIVKDKLDVMIKGERID